MRKKIDYLLTQKTQSYEEKIHLLQCNESIMKTLSESLKHFKAKATVIKLNNDEKRDDILALVQDNLVSNASMLDRRAASNPETNQVN